MEKLNTKTMVCENEYVDNGYLDDYLNYYVGCHENYSKLCSRIHFFSEVFDYDKFEEIIISEEKDKKDELGQYLGFVVIKPIPMTFIGRTCLKVPIELNSDNATLITRNYTADLFGLELKVQSLAFQEQDQVVSACTSASIWCLLHALQIRKIKSPAQITLAATEHSKIINTFPNSGLNPVEIERALEYFDLSQVTVSPKGETEEDLLQLTQFIKTYVDSNIPMIIGAECFEKTSTSEAYKEIGKHAVTIIGYDLNDSGKLDKLIVHDDRQGPFTVLKLVPKYSIEDKDHRVTVLIKDEISKNSSVEKCERQEILVYKSLIIATDPRVRIGFNIISKTEMKLQALVQLHINAQATKTNKDRTSKLEVKSVKVTVRSRLLKSSEYKQSIKSLKLINKSEILTRNFPKYLWIIELSLDGSPLFELVFDSSCLPQGEAFICSAYDSEGAELLLHSLANEYYDSELKDRGEYRFRDSDFILQVLKSIKVKPNSFFNYHDDMFGRARMPTLIKPTEMENEQLNDPKNRLVLYNSFDNRIDDENNRFKALLKQQALIDSPWEEKGKVQKLIWIISEYGALFIGKNSQETGHPTLTGAKPARIGGEFIVNIDKPDTVYVNHFSGRYSTNFKDDQNKEFYLKQAMIKIGGILSDSGYSFELDERLKQVTS